MSNFELFHKSILEDYPESVRCLYRNIKKWDIDDPNTIGPFVLNDKKAKQEIKSYIDTVKDQGANKEAQMNAMKNIFIFIMWSTIVYADNNKSFNIAKNLLISLAHTDPVLDITDVQFPFNNIYVEFDKSAKIKMPTILKDGSDDEIIILGVYLKNNVDSIQLMLVTRLIKDEYKDIDLRILPSGISWRIQKRIYNSKREFSESLRSNKNYKNQYDTLLEDVSSIIINILYYIDSLKNNFEFIETSRRTVYKGFGKKRKKKIITDGYIILGRETLELASDYCFDTSSITPKFKHKFRFMVRGHWRDQPIGKRGSGEYKKIRIEPFVKGSDGVPFLNKEYKVK